MALGCLAIRSGHPDRLPDLRGGGGGKKIICAPPLRLRLATALTPMESAQILVAGNGCKMFSGLIVLLNKWSD